MFFTLNQIVHLLETYKYFLLFPIAVIEGPIITVIAGFLVSLGHMNIFIAYAVVVAGDIVGDALYYWIGKSGGQFMLSKFGHILGVSPDKIAFVKKHFHKHPNKTLLFGKFTHAFGVAILIAAGIVNINFWRFIAVNFASTLVKSLALLLVGYFFGQAYVQINSYINNATAIIAVGGIVLLAGFLATRTITKNYFKE